MALDISKDLVGEVETLPLPDDYLVKPKSATAIWRERIARLVEDGQSFSVALPETDHTPQSRSVLGYRLNLPTAYASAKQLGIHLCIRTADDFRSVRIWRVPAPPPKPAPEPYQGPEIGIEWP